VVCRGVDRCRNRAQLRARARERQHRDRFRDAEGRDAYGHRRGRAHRGAQRAPRNTGGFAAALLSALYAYNGWIVITSIAGEIKRPGTTIPLALFGGVTLVVVLYVLANAAFVRVLGFAQILHLGPAASVGITSAERLFGSAWGGISSAILLFSVIATLHVVVLNYSRITYAIAQDGLFLAPLSVLGNDGVPVRAVVATSAIALGLVLVMGFERLSDWFTFEIWLIFVIAVVGLFALRRSEPQALRPYRVSGYPFVPAAFLIVAGYILVVTAITRPLDAGLALAVTLTGPPVYAAATALRTRRKDASS
jgi:APA family basic amino acid/polyamine antiporter